ncbi:transcription initiation factor TFIID component TAF4 family-domain-containing protein [Mycena belliarum]|uniref:Transcription initiation factor TFIID subunit 4 n=1 Tax=Mycena belliarum TaxID=1033014 RepID=A0AAD6TZC6_9AGAR|nr:transcription initiation factor TFIID component TAF4 family-domain-containing protein [Mycena belliae]
MSGGPVIPAISAEIWDSLIPIDGDAADTDASPTTTVTTTAPTPATTPAPAAAYQHYQQYAHYQQQAAYQPQAYQGYQPYAPQQQETARAPVSMQRQAIANVHAQSSSGGALDTADVATLNDALGSAGVDLRAEEESLQRTTEQPQPFRAFEDRARKQPLRPHFDAVFLGATMRAMAAHHKVTGVPEDCVTYLALALRARLQDLVTAMIGAARHRRQAQWDRAPGVYEDGRAAWGLLVRADVARQLTALELVEREEETRLRAARARREAAIDAAVVAALAGEDQPVEIPAVDEEGGQRNAAAENEMETTNAEARRAAGLAGKYAWLTAGQAASARPRPYKATKRGASPPPLPPDADQRMPINIRDAMFAVEKERGHGGGRGAARGWT